MQDCKFAIFTPDFTKTLDFPSEDYVFKWHAASARIWFVMFTSRLSNWWNQTGFKADSLNDSVFREI